MKTMTKMTFLLLSIVLISCNSTKKTADGSPTADYEVLYQQAYGGHDEKSNEVIKDKEALDKMLSQGAITDEQKAGLETIDFDKKMVVVLHSGTKNTGGYDIGVASVRVNGETTYVVIDETGPKPGENVTMALTNPYCIVLLDKNEHVVFED